MASKQIRLFREINMKKWILILLLILSQSLFAVQQVRLIPQPQEIEEYDRKFNLADSTTIFISSSQLLFSAHLLQQVFKECLNIEVALSEKKQTKSIQLILGNPDKSTQNLLKKYKLALDAQLGDEGYLLLLLPEKIIVAAHSEKGVFYGIQTLKQIIRGNSKNRSLPCLKIKDWPDLPIRGVSDDISRGPIPTLPYFKKCIRRLSELKYNSLVYYTENVIRTKKHGAFAPAGALSINEVKELSNYAQKYHIELMGCFQSFGHFEKILEYPQYEHLGEMGSMLTPTKKESYDLLTEIYSEIVPAFNSKYFWVLGDELWALGKGYSENMVNEKGFAQVFANHMNWINKELKKYDKTIVVTADEPLKHPKAFELLDKDIIILPWDYSAKESFMDMLKPVKENGFDMLILPGVDGWRKIYPTSLESKINIQNFIRDGLFFDNLLGVFVATWDDWGYNFFNNNWYGLAYGADQAWHSFNDQAAHFEDRFSATTYGDSNNIIGQAIVDLINIGQYSTLQNFETTQFWKDLVPPNGSKGQISLRQWPQIKNAAIDVKRRLTNVKPSQNQQDLEYIIYACDQLVFMADYRFALVEIAKQYRSASLEQDKTAECRQKLSIIIKEISSLVSTWENLSETYQHLWRLENRTYWLENVTANFDHIINDLYDVKRRVQSALDDFDKSLSLPSPMRVRLDISELTEEFFQTWLMCGSFPNPKKDPSKASHVPNGCVEFDTDFLSALGGELNASPVVRDFVRLPDSNELTWKHHTTNLGAIVDLRDYFDETERVVAYAYCEMLAPENMTVTAGLGSNDGIKVFLNGDQVFQEHELRFVKPDDDLVPLLLKKGKNSLMLKIDQGRGQWGFTFRLLDVSFENQQHVYKIID
jgi:hexosaminidase